MTHSRPAIRELLESNHLAPRRDLGQNFVADPNTVRRIADLARVGPATTSSRSAPDSDRSRSRSPTPVPTITAIEVDRGIVPLLRDVMADRANVTVVEADAMQLDWNATARPDVDGGWVLVANLPYNVATPLICDILDTRAADRSG